MCFSKKFNNKLKTLYYLFYIVKKRTNIFFNYSIFKNFKKYKTINNFTYIMLLKSNKLKLNIYKKKIKKKITSKNFLLFYKFIFNFLKNKIYFNLNYNYLIRIKNYSECIPFIKTQLNYLIRNKLNDILNLLYIKFKIRNKILNKYIKSYLKSITPTLNDNKMYTNTLSKYIYLKNISYNQKKKKIYLYMKYKKINLNKSKNYINKKKIFNNLILINNNISFLNSKIIIKEENNYISHLIKKKWKY